MSRASATAPIEAAPGGVRLTIQAQPRAARSEVVGLHGGAVKIRLAAPPADGAANAELVRFLAERLEVSRAAIEIRSGHAARRKVLVVGGTTVALATARLLEQD